MPFFKKKTFIIFILFFSVFIPKSESQDLYDIDNSSKFANYLIKTKQFEFASRELERIIFLNPENDSLKLLLLTSYRYSGNYKTAINRTREFFKDVSSISSAFASEYSKNLLLNNSFSEARTFLKSNTRLEPEKSLFFKMSVEFLDHSNQKNRYITRKWASTQQMVFQDTLNAVPYDTLKFLSPPLSDYKNILDEGLRLKYKKPLIAVGLSAIIPGAGKVYTGDWPDGLVSFIIVAPSAFVVYNALHNNGKLRTPELIYAFIGTGFYLGNIYGSHKSARKHNLRLNEKLQKKAEEVFRKNI